MPKYPKNYKDVEYYVPGGKRRIAGSTKATSDFLTLVHLDHPDATIFQLQERAKKKVKQSQIQRWNHLYGSFRKRKNA